MFERLDNENEEQFLWRIGQAKDNGLVDLSWNEIADIINKEFRDDTSEYLGEAAYRKPYQQAKRFYEHNTFDNLAQDDYIKEIKEAKYELREEKQRLSDERIALNKILRERARTKEDLQKLESLVKDSGNYSFPNVQHDTAKVSDNDLVICLSDFHLGLEVDNYFGRYDSDIAEKRLIEYLQEIVNIRNLHQSENAFVLLLGDILNGEIHFTTQLENRENVTLQIQKSAELISAFVYELSKNFKNVYVNGVAGNHSRTSFKDQVLRGNRLDNLIPWYIKAKLAHINNIYFTDDDNYDPTIACYNVRGKQYVAVHGDYDGYSEKGVSKLVMLLGFKPAAIFYGHLHRCSYDDIAGIKIVRSGSFSGTCDDYTISKRLSGKPSQMVCVINDNGIKACYPIELH